MQMIAGALIVLAGAVLAGFGVFGSGPNADLYREFGGLLIAVGLIFAVWGLIRDHRVKK